MPRSVIWLGDLNSRINLDSEATRTLATRGDYEALRAHDQLLSAIRTGASFDGFSEAALDFAPTYKYDIGTDVFDTSEKKRPPAWCDRVLWRVLAPAVPSPREVAPSGAASPPSVPPPRLRCVSYDRHDERTSDHRPVSSELDLLVARSDEAERARVAADISRSLDAWENSSMPTAELDATECDFGPLVYGEPARQSVTITNVGQTALKFSFEPLPLPDDDGPGAALPPWLEVSPMRSMLMPGEACRVLLTARVAKPHAAALTEAALRGGGDAPRRLESVLLLHLLHGRDFFLPIRASWRASCIGLRLCSRLSVGAALFASLRQTPTEDKAGDCGPVAALASAELVPVECKTMLAVIDAAVERARTAATHAVEAAGVVQRSAVANAPDATTKTAEAGVGAPADAQQHEPDHQAAEKAAEAARDASAAAEALFNAFPDEALAGSTSTMRPSTMLKADSAALLPALEAGESLPSTVSLPAVGFTLLRWAIALADAVIPPPLLADAEAAAPSKTDSFAVACRLPPEHAAVFAAIVLCLRRLLRAHAAAASAATSAAEAAGKDMGTRSTEAAWAIPIKPLPAEYCGKGPDGQVMTGSAARPDPTVRDDAKNAVPRVALSSRLCTLFGSAFLGARNWWPAVFIRHFIADELERADETLEWIVGAGSQSRNVPHGKADAVQIS